MRFSEYLIEDVGKQQIIGSIGQIARSNGEDVTSCFEYMYELNKNGHVNFLRKNNRYIIGMKFCLDLTKKNISVYTFNLFLENRLKDKKKIIGKLLRAYYLQPFYLTAFIILSIIPIVVYTVNNFPLILGINALIVSTILIHELGHYFSAHLLNVDTAFHITGIKTSVLYKTDDPIKSIIISSFGFIANLICLSLVLVVKSVNHDIYLQVLSMFCALVQIVFMLSITPVCQDGKNIVEGFTKVLRRVK